jgi:hypothetical protein
MGRESVIELRAVSRPLESFLYQRSGIGSGSLSIKGHYWNLNIVESQEGMVLCQEGDQ